MKRVLVVDDDQDSTELMVRYLRPLDYTADTAFSGSEALEKLRQSTYDIVISDVRMSNGSGIDLLREIQAQKIRVPVVLVSAAFQAAKPQAKAMGADAFLAKPLTMESLAEVVKRLEEAPKDASEHASEAESDSSPETSPEMRGPGNQPPPNGSQVIPR